MRSLVYEGSRTEGKEIEWLVPGYTPLARKSALAELAKKKKKRKEKEKRKKEKEKKSTKIQEKY